MQWLGHKQSAAVYVGQRGPSFQDSHNCAAEADLPHTADTGISEADSVPIRSPVKLGGLDAKPASRFILLHSQPPMCVAASSSASRGLMRGQGLTAETGIYLTSAYLTPPRHTSVCGVGSAPHTPSCMMRTMGEGGQEGEDGSRLGSKPWLRSCSSEAAVQQPPAQLTEDALHHLLGVLIVCCMVNGLVQPGEE